MHDDGHCSLSCLLQNLLEKLAFIAVKSFGLEKQVKVVACPRNQIRPLGQKPGGRFVFFGAGDLRGHRLPGISRQHLHDILAECKPAFPVVKGRSVWRLVMRQRAA